MGIALLGSVMNAAYAPHATGISPRDSAAAGRSLGEAYDIAERLGGAPGSALRHAARHSFVQGMHVTLLVSAALLVGGACAALRLPRVMECEAAGAGAVAKAAAQTVRPASDPARHRTATVAVRSGRAGD
jgi:DHA2 family multidrug resistance protein-like MFS transporter